MLTSRIFSQDSAPANKFFCQLNSLLGTPFAEEKKQLMQPTGTFLGLDHDFTNLGRGFVTFWARDRLIQKTAAMLTEAQAHNSLSSGQASKLYGMLNFLEQGMYGRLGCAGLAAIKARQTERNRDLTPELQRNFDGTTRWDRFGKPSSPTFLGKFTSCGSLAIGRLPSWRW